MPPATPDQVEGERAVRFLQRIRGVQAFGLLNLLNSFNHPET